MRLTKLRTPRLTLRPFRSGDLDPFAAMNCDPRVMEHFPSIMDRGETEVLMQRIAAHGERHGFSLWAVEVPEVTDFAGFVGLAIPSFESHFTPCVEIGWRLAYAYWGRGYASEGARAAVDFGFYNVGLEEIVSFTVPANRRSQAVMERLGMSYDERDDFDHPRLPPGDPLRRHVLYRLTREEWTRTSGVSGPHTSS